MAHEPSTSITYENVLEKLVEYVPEVKEAYEAELKWWGAERPGPHVVYGDVLNPYIDRLLQAGDQTALRRVFSLLEVLSSSEDVRVQEVVAVTVCEHLGSDQQKLAQAKRFMGRATLKISDDVEKFWKK